MADKNYLDDDKMFSGFIWGLIAGIIIALFKAPRIRPEINLDRTRERLLEATGNFRDTLENAMPSDPITKSIAEGKEAARRRRSELGIEN